MKTNLLLVVIFLLAGNMAWAEYVPMKEAAQVAENYYYEKSNLNRSEIQFEKTIVVEGSDSDLYYIFNLKSGKGFIIISAEDSYKPVIAYSLSSEYVVENQPEFFQSWMKTYKSQINYLRENNIKANNDIAALWNKYNVSAEAFVTDRSQVKIVDPLTASIPWNQSGGSSQGFNGGWDYFTPEGTPTGCVATAMSIIMYYWQYPIQGSGSNSYYQYPYGTLSANFGNTTYMWSNMFDTDPTYYSALLQYHAGIAVDMSYDPEGSGAFSTDVPYALETYFNYSTSTDYETREGYSNIAWKNLLKANLDNSIPVYYSGRDEDNGGHAFVCDGYDNSDDFHFNFGWGGWNNGYYSIDDVGGFYIDNAVVRNIEPETTYYPYQPSVSNFSAAHDVSNETNFEVDLSWDTPAKSEGKSLTGYDIYRGEDLLEENYPSSSNSYADNELTVGSDNYYAVRAIYSDGTSLCASEFVSGTFTIDFYVLDAESGSAVLNAAVTFNGETKTMGYTSIDFNNVPFGHNYPYHVEHPDYEEDLDGIVDLVNGNETYYVYLGATSVDSYNQNIIKLYPNPATEFIWVDTNNTELMKYDIVDITGKLVNAGTVSESKKIILDRMDSGFYIIKLQSKSQSFSETFIVK
ncbi:MAG: thiol protease/hemagglutinin PrtT [Bacteroidota bacterium]|nr:thiol protease/hemagglutinin PrtT [Bacteroidota bacterium]